MNKPKPFKPSRFGGDDFDEEHPRYRENLTPADIIRGLPEKLYLLKKMVDSFLEDLTTIRKTKNGFESLYSVVNSVKRSIDTIRFP